jgi:hypothetical protein
MVLVVVISGVIGAVKAQELNAEAVANGQGFWLPSSFYQRTQIQATRGKQSSALPLSYLGVIYFDNIGNCRRNSRRACVFSVKMGTSATQE